MSTAETPSRWADSKEAWTQRVHDAMLPSGIRVTYRDLSLAEHAFLEELPAELLAIAVAEWSEPGSVMGMVGAPLETLTGRSTKKQRDAAEAEARKILVQLAAVNRHLIAAALVDPVMTAEELQHIPMPDLEMLAALVNRTLAVDAAGRRVGVVPIEQFRVVLEAHGHEPCPPDCPSCQEARRGLSTVR